MTPDYSFDEDVQSREDFEAVLETLLTTAFRNDIDIFSSQVYDIHDGNEPDVEVQFFQLEPDGRPDWG